METCGFSCCICQSPVIRLHYAPALGWVPAIRHWQLAEGTWCPALDGDPFAGWASMDLLDALAAVVNVGTVRLSQYEEPVWHARELVTA